MGVLRDSASMNPCAVGSIGCTIPTPSVRPILPTLPKVMRRAPEQRL
jgi:hypothetical protein